MDFLVRNIRLVVLVIGFGSGLAGTLGSFVFIETLNEDIQDLTNRQDAAVQEIARLGSLSSDYFIANQQGDLIYALALQPDANYELLALIYQGNLIDRAEPMRNMIGAMAIAGLLDYRQTYDQSEKLADKAIASTDFASFIAVKEFERSIVQESQNRGAYLQLSLAPLQSELSAAEGRLRSRHQLMILFPSAGAFLLLLANLVEHRRSVASASQPTPSGEPVVARPTAPF